MAYAKLLRYVKLGYPEQPNEFHAEARSDLGRQFEVWFNEGGAGLLISGPAFARFQPAANYSSRD